ncbi:MAG TPA: flavin reductase family protein [Erysipelotrichaceae bacterium]|jgi:flavin reductase (DIM6/NTAB) family NADH-FMN oxidoreductase RutF|nr:flavin reductase family protein [Erysipelotrichia bacterium]HPX32796.1 flavin reductase family protein [Erysipelotrichaceae bacterium]HQA84676.1 flavin reductase family protein [Erysipelotrichaceae bacterium]
MKELINPFEKFYQHWALVTAGKKDHFNTMTVAWGSMGTVWSRPIVTIYIKPCRYTYNFLNENDYFTVSFYDEKYKKDMSILGTKSGKDTDKIALTSLTPVEVNGSMSFEEANCTIVLKKIYYQDMDINQMPSAVVNRYYTEELPHRMYIGEVVEIIEK